jgi:acetoin:2,6-dichlorophenolindophenol oxidoreductase subunit beta
MKEQRILKYNEALDEALLQGMENDPNVYVMGCGVDDASGIFGTTVAAAQRFGNNRVMDVPLAENAIAGIGVGSAIMGKRPVMVHARNDFLMLAMDQIVNHAAKWELMSGGKLKCPLVIRAIVGRGWGQAAQHSQSLQAMFSHVPGLKVALPASAYDAKGLLLAALQNSGPVILIEHRLLYETTSQVPKYFYTVPLGEGKIVRSGRDITIIAFSYMVKEALNAAKVLEAEGIDVEIIDPRSTSPLDLEIILSSVRKTRRVIVADTGWENYGVTAEVCSRIYEKAFRLLKGPIKRIALPNADTPCSPTLENEYYPGIVDLIKSTRILMKLESEEIDKIEPVSLEHESFQGPF